MLAMERQLKDLRGIGRKMLGDFRKLGIRSVGDLKSRDANQLYDRICILTGTRQDPCVLDTYRCAIEQARNPDFAQRADELVVLVTAAQKRVLFIIQLLSDHAFAVNRLRR